jgi:FkbM family methyltransferase
VTIKSTVRNLVADVAGIHLSRRSLHPEVTLLGLADRAFSHVVDVGANEGQFARDIRLKFRNATIISFEPAPEPFARLALWALEDGNAHAVNCALGEFTGEALMHFHTEHSPSSSLLATTARSHADFPMTQKQSKITVPVERLDDALANPALKLKDGFLLKLDVQGFEGAVLRGAAVTLKKAGACIVEVCLDQLYDGQSDFVEVASLATAGGMRYAGNLSQVCAVDGHVAYLDALFVR